MTKAVEKIRISCPVCGENFEARVIEHLINGMKRSATVELRPDLTQFWLHTLSHVAKGPCKKHDLKYVGIFAPEVVPSIYHTWVCKRCDFRDFQNVDEFTKLWTNA